MVSATRIELAFSHTPTYIHAYTYNIHTYKYLAWARALGRAALGSRWWKVLSLVDVFGLSLHKLRVVKFVWVFNPI